ncbi:MAG: sortase, partial [Rubrobacter sp.]
DEGRDPTFEPLEFRDAGENGEPLVALDRPSPTGGRGVGGNAPRRYRAKHQTATRTFRNAQTFRIGAGFGFGATFAGRSPEPTTASAARSPLPSEPQNWPAARPEEVAAANGERDYGAIPRGAVLGLTIDAIGIKNAPVWPDDSPAYLDRGVTHAPETSLPWSGTPERNTYLAAHRIGYPSTGSRLLFSNLDQLSEGDEIVLARSTGKKYTYRVTEMFVVEPSDSWVMGRVRDRDMVTLQTCTPIPTFEKRLIIRADRV